MKIRFAITLTGAGVAPALAEVVIPIGHDWNCRNADMKISCGAGRCDVADAHMPMDVSVSPFAMTACA